MGQSGRVIQVNISAGGVPKLPVPGPVHVGRYGLAGDAHREDTVHGGPHRAVALFAIEAIRRVAAEGHPIAPGTAGENLTTEGIELAGLPIGTRLAIGEGLVLELSSPDNPCSTIRGSFGDGRFARISILTHPLDSRMYARVVREGVVGPGDAIQVFPPAADSPAADLALLARLGHAHRASSLAQWRAAAAAGLDVRVLDDEEILAVAAPSYPGPGVNAAVGFDLLPNLIGRALDHFRAHGVTGWLELDPDDPATPPVEPDEHLVVLAGAPDHLVGEPEVAGLTVRRIGPEDAATWATTLARAADFPEAVRLAMIAFAPGLATTPHHSLWLAELEGTPVGTGSLHVGRRAGFMRSGTVVAEARGRGIQRALIGARARAAVEAGADLIGSTAAPESVSERNLLRIGLQAIARRGLYPSTAF